MPFLLPTLTQLADPLELRALVASGADKKLLASWTQALRQSQVRQLSLTSATSGRPGASAPAYWLVRLRWRVRADRRYAERKGSSFSTACYPCWTAFPARHMQCTGLQRTSTNTADAQVLQELAGYTAQVTQACTRGAVGAAGSMQGAMHVLSLLLEDW